MLEDRASRDDDDARFTTSLAGLAFSLFLIVIALYVLDGLAEQSKLEDCMLQGRMNCERVDLSSARYNPSYP